MPGTNPVARITDHPNLDTINDPPVRIPDNHPEGRETIPLDIFMTSLEAFVLGEGVNQAKLDEDFSLVADDWAAGGDMKAIQDATVAYVGNTNRVRFLRYLRSVMSAVQTDNRFKNDELTPPMERMYPNLKTVANIITQAENMTNAELGL